MDPHPLRKAQITGSFLQRTVHQVRAFLRSLGPGVFTKGVDCDKGILLRPISLVPKVGVHPFFLVHR